jgi:HEPN domain-containing protein
VNYRKELAQGFLQEATEDLNLKRYRSCVDNSQLSIENSVKAVLAFFGPVPRTHNPSAAITDLIQSREFEDEIKEALEHLRDLSSGYGLREHFLTDYGDELQKLSPWQIFSREDAEQALDTANQCFSVMNDLLQRLSET